MILLVNENRDFKQHKRHLLIYHTRYKDSKAMRHSIIYSLITYHLIGLIFCTENADETRDSKSYKGAGMSLNHPGKC